jgi:hypothetical protein
MSEYSHNSITLFITTKAIKKKMRCLAKKNSLTKAAKKFYLFIRLNDASKSHD